ncbi:endoplasmic reticulum junction formation protein lunapark-B isoform X2 [Ischnura elegans]|uniref:endoplasmic reticulum junction formation protein lunapark-B isoform X2 n=1 Tax=Ischnura elegans TaxID=197161 RepID=UPI001ED8BA60|nr:endoplasmic reticulum junction formation protein lunapark-B isoform X2 [Ischnura elegans]
MGAIFSRKKKKSTKERLEQLEKDIRKIEEFRQHTEQKRKRTAGKLLLYGIPIYGLVALGIYFYEFPRTFLGKILAVTPLLILPILFILLRRFLTWYFRRQLTHNEEKLSELYAEKKKILEDVMETETYKVAKEILEKFAPDQLRNKESQNGNQSRSFVQNVSGTPGPVTPDGLRRRVVNPNQAMQPTPMQPGARPMGQRVSPPGAGAGRGGQVRTPMPPSFPPINGQQGFGRISPQSSRQVMTVSQGFYRASTGQSVVATRTGTVSWGIAGPNMALLRNGGGVMMRGPPGPPMPRPIPPYERSFLDRMVEYLVGDGPNNRFALICQQCESHNGMALREEFEYLSFRCCYCYHWNPARKQRPHAPRLPTLPPPGSPSARNKDAEESGSEEEGSEESSSDGQEGEPRAEGNRQARESLGAEDTSEGAGVEGTGSEATPASSSSVSPSTEEGSGGDPNAALEGATSADSGTSSKSPVSVEHEIETEMVMLSNS